MIRNIFNTQVKKWLFLSATPLHNGTDSIKNTINEYACKGEQWITKEECEVGAEFALQKKLQQVLIRRPRTYIVSENRDEMGKTEYRYHNSEHDGIAINRPIPALSLALIQKKLVRILEGQNNRFKIGFLSSFESLQDSLSADSRLKRRKSTDFEISDAADGEEIYEDSDDADIGSTNLAPDEQFISRITSDFQNRFGFPLPHPKLNHLVEHIWRHAFLENEKYLIFVRRISTVFELERLLENKYLTVVEERMLTVWGEHDIWRMERDPIDSVDDDDERPSDDGAEGVPDSDNPLRKALSRGGWLFNFRRLFRGTGRYSMIFQENWFTRLCRIQELNPDEVIPRIPEEIWRESITHSQRGKKKKARYRANRFQYIITQLVHRSPEIFKLTNGRAEHWQEFFRSIYPDAFQKECEDRKSTQVIDQELFTNSGFWELWEEQFAQYEELYLGPVQSSSVDRLLKREIVKNWIVQFLLLSDTILDFYCASKNRTEDEFLKTIFHYVKSEDLHAKSLRTKLRDWIIHRDLILKNSFELGQSSLGSFAAQMSYTELDNPRAVVGMVGGNVNQTAIKQFKTPGYPQILVCTDVLKEGEDLHTFCDKIIHYGLAWTAGDLEQRVGRVDRYFSQIERRLFESRDKNSVKLMIYYPHMIHSLEREQVERVVRRQRFAERVMDHSLVYNDKSQKELCQGESDKIDLQNQLLRIHEDHPFTPKQFNDSHPIPTISREETNERLEYYHNLIRSLEIAAEENDVRIVGEMHRYTEPVDLFVPNDMYPEGRLWRFKLNYIAELGSYAMKGTSLSDEDEYEQQTEKFAFEREVVGGVETLRKVIRIYLPLMASVVESLEMTFSDVFRYLKTEHVKPSDAKKSLDDLSSALIKLGLRDNVRCEKGNKLTATVHLGDRKQNVSVYLYEGMIFLSSRIGRKDQETKDGRSLDDEEYLLSLNSSIQFGYFSLHRNYITFCKRLFWHDYNAEFVSKIIITLAQKADLYEMQFFGLDRR